jgi:hypothetical protein
MLGRRAQNVRKIHKQVKWVNITLVSPIFGLTLPVIQYKYTVFRDDRTPSTKIDIILLEQYPRRFCGKG